MRSDLCSFGPGVVPAVAELCVLYGQAEEDMVSELVAFCTSTHKMNITSETLGAFEHEVRPERRPAQSVVGPGPEGRAGHLSWQGVPV